MTLILHKLELHFLFDLSKKVCYNLVRGVHLNKGCIMDSKNILVVALLALATALGVNTIHSSQRIADLEQALEAKTLDVGKLQGKNAGLEAGKADLLADLEDAGKLAERAADAKNAKGDELAGKGMLLDAAMFQRDTVLELRA